jgi:hypothetical protein
VRNDPGIPVPIEPAILALAQIAQQALGIARARTFRVIGRHGIDRFIERSKAIGIERA